METVFVITRTCYGEDYPESVTDVEIFGTSKKAEKRFKEILQQEEDYTGKRVSDEVEKDGNEWYLDFIDPDNDYRVVMTLSERDVK